METICIDGEYYDPYYILGVSVDDDLKQISLAYKTKAKKYHPDKAKTKQDSIKFQKRFKIILDSYQYIKNKRIEIGKTPILAPQKQEYANPDLFESPTNFGYGEQTRYNSPEDYEKFQEKIVRQFDGKKFSIDDFNRLFEYNADRFDFTSSEKSLIHKTTDGFYGYNTADIGDCAIVSSFNGLMITGDNFGESNIGYWSTNYSDYKRSYEGPRNPNKKVSIPRDFVRKNEFEEISTSTRMKKIEEERKKSIKQLPCQHLYKRNMDELVLEQEKNKDIVLRYANQYNEHIVQAALDGRLEQSPNLIGKLKEHYQPRELQN